MKRFLLEVITTRIVLLHHMLNRSILQIEVMDRRVTLVHMRALDAPVSARGFVANYRTGVLLILVVKPQIKA